MKNTINFYYNIFLDEFVKKDNCYCFYYGGDEYYFVPLNRPTDDILGIYKLNLEMKKRKCLVHELILNKDKSIITVVSGISYVLIRLCKYKNDKVFFNDINYIQNMTINIECDKNLIRNDWIKLWSEKIGCAFYGKSNTDPSGVIFDGLTKSLEENADYVFIDTAGRLQNKENLMRELEKMNKVIGRIIPGAPHETLLVIDATTGQNGILQAEAFKSITNITGIVLTKLDGTAKGGIVLAIKESVGIPVKFIGLGEKMTDLKTFDIESYIYGLFKDMM